MIANTPHSLGCSSWADSTSRQHTKEKGGRRLKRYSLHRPWTPLVEQRGGVYGLPLDFSHGALRSVDEVAHRIFSRVKKAVTRSVNEEVKGRSDGGFGKLFVMTRLPCALEVEVHFFGSGATERYHQAGCPSYLHHSLRRRARTALGRHAA